MERRKALKNISLGMGASISAPTLMSIISSCRTASDSASSATTVFKPSFLEANQYKIVELFVDKLLPTTNTPGALDVKVPEVIDFLLNKVFEPAEQGKFKAAFNGFASTLKTDQKVEVGDIGANHIDAFFTKYMAPKNEGVLDKAKMFIDKDIDEISEAEKPLAQTYKFIRTLSDMAVNIFFRTEEIATNHLNFDPIPGVYKDISLEEVGGKQWAL